MKNIYSSASCISTNVVGGPNNLVLLLRAKGLPTVAIYTSHAEFFADRIELFNDKLEHFFVHYDSQKDAYVWDELNYDFANVMVMTPSELLSESSNIIFVSYSDF